MGFGSYTAMTNQFTENKTSFLIRLLGDIEDSRDFLLKVVSELKANEIDEETMFYFIRKVVKKCDYVSEQLEKEFLNKKEDNENR